MKGDVTIKIVAKSAKGHEFMYNAKSAHKVSEASTKYICDILNEYKYKLNDDEVWFIHDVDKYDMAYEYAEFQRFTVRNGIVKEKVA